VISRKATPLGAVEWRWLRGVLDILHQPAVLLDQFHHVLVANNAFYDLLGMIPQSATGGTLRDLGNGLLDAPGLQAFLDSVDVDPVRASTQRFEINKGPHLQRKFVLKAIRVPAGALSGTAVVTIEEIGRSNRMNEFLGTAQGSQQTLSAIAAADHDLRQPLQTLSLLQGVLAAREKDPELHKLVDRLEEAIEALTGILHATVSIDQLARGSIEPAIGTFPIGSVINRLRTELAYHADARGLEWRVVPSSVAVRSDAYLLGQVLRALLMQAMKLIARGKVLLGCRRRGNRLIIQVWISGTGVTAERQEIILNEFHTSPASPVPNNLVGLLVTPLSKRLKLAVKARSRPGNGLVFTSEIPIEPQLVSGTLRPNSTPKGTILVTSDDPNVRDSLVMLLREMGHEPLTASADDGFASLLSNKDGSVRPEVAIVSFGQTPERNAKAIVSLRWMLGWEIPAIAIGDDVSKGTNADAVGDSVVYLPAPLRPAELTPHIARFLALVRYRAAVSRRSSRDTLRQAVFVVDDDSVLREVIRDVLGYQRQNVELFSSSEEFLKAYRRDRQGCLIIDNRLPGISGVEVLERLKAEGSSIPSIMITGHSDISTAIRAMKAGAIDYLEKPISYEALLTAVERALETGRGSAEAHLKRQELAARLTELTPRERQVMELVVAGRSSKKIAQILKISQRTVENHRAAIMRRAGVTSLPDLIRIVMQLQLSEKDQNQ
jgi:two-component system, chemotaxis family, CheB/CheR fusion protein